MQYWLCEYQSECDVPVACKKLDGFTCHGKSLKVIPALKAKYNIKRPSDSLSFAMQISEFTQCMVCNQRYSTSSDLATHLLLAHKLHPNVDVTKTAVMRGKVLKERPCSKSCSKSQRIEQQIDPEKTFDIRSWVADRPHRNPDYEQPDDYVLDTVIGLRADNEKLGFIPIDHLYADLGNVVRGMVPNSVLNGPDSITFHPSMACLMQLGSKFRYVPVEHSYAQLYPEKSWCSVCGRKYDSIEALQNHLPVHFKKKNEKILEGSDEVSRKRKLKRAPKDETFTCKMCSNEFDSKSIFIAHVAAHENDDEVELPSPKKCQYCYLTFSCDVKMIKHQILHECEKCDEKFKCLKEAQDHRDSHILSEKAKCCCEICGQKFLNVTEFYNHLMKNTHPITKEARSILNIPLQSEYFGKFLLQTRNGDFHCLKCSKTCQSDIELYSHMGFHFVHDSIPSPYLLEEESNEKSATTCDSTLQEYEPVKVKISLLSILAATSPSDVDKGSKIRDLDKDSKISDVDKDSNISDVSPNNTTTEKCVNDSDSVVCEKCDKKFGSIRGLRTHSRFCRKRKKKVDLKNDQELSTKNDESLNPPQPSFNCMKCDIVFETEILLMTHINNLHQKNDMSQAKLGKAKKSAVKLYRCSYCDKTFAQELGLKAHNAAVHSDISSTTNAGLQEVLKSSLDANESPTKEPFINTTPAIIENDVRLENTASLSTILQDSDKKDNTDSDADIEHSILKRHTIIKSPTQHEAQGHIRARKTAAKLFKCRTCDIRFGSKRILSFHMQQHADGKIKPSSNGVHDKKNNSKILGDVLTNHDPPEKAVLSSPVCSPKINDLNVVDNSLVSPQAKSRKVAKKTIIKKVFECDICEELFTKRTEYITHIKAHTNDPNDTSSISDTEEDLEIKSTALNKDTKKESIGNNERVQDEEHDNCPTNPPLAGKEVLPPVSVSISDSQDLIAENAIFYVDDDKLDSVMNGSSKQPTPAASNALEVDCVSRVQESVSDELKTCNICKKQFVAWSTICAHMSLHPDATFNDVSVDWKSRFNPLFECVICQQRIHSVAHCYLHYKFHVLEHCPTALISHIDASKSSDLNLQDFRCSVCGLEFDKIGTLHNHIKVHIPRVGFDDPTQVVSHHSHEKCDICNRLVTSKSRRRHFEIHDQELKHICEVCFCEFPNQGKYIEHYYKMHKPSFETGVQLAASNKSNGIGKTSLNVSEISQQSKSDAFSCSYCRLSFSSAKSKRRHEYKHKQGVFKMRCSYNGCVLHFQSNEELMYHIEKMGHAIGLVSIPCSVCDSKFMSVASKTEHERSVHDIEADSKDKKSEDFEVVNTNTNEKLICDKCEQCFHSNEILNSHDCENVDIHPLGGNDDGCRNEDNDNDSENCENDQLNEDFTCSVCSKKFSSYSERWLHEEEFESLGNYKCMECGLDYKTKHFLKNHECNAKPSTSPVDEGPKSSSGLRIIGFTNRKCHACNKLFNDKESFKYHVRKHWYRCFSCHYDFCSKKSLKAHSKLQKCFHPNIDGYDKAFEKIFVQCLLCDEAFSISDHVNMHFLNHTIKENGKYDMYICMMCGAPYKIIEQLQAHMKAEGYFMLCREFPHLKDINRIKDIESAAEGTGSTENEAAELPQLWGCPFCSTTYNNYKSAWSHIRSYHKSQGKPFKMENDETNVSLKPQSKDSESPCVNEKIIVANTEFSSNKKSDAGFNHISQPSFGNNNPVRLDFQQGSKFRLHEQRNHQEDNYNGYNLQKEQHHPVVLSANAVSYESYQNEVKLSRSASQPRSSSETTHLTVVRSRSSSETSNPANLPKKLPVTSPEAAAKTAGLIAQILRGPLLPNPSPSKNTVSNEADTSYVEPPVTNAYQIKSPVRFSGSSAQSRQPQPNHTTLNRTFPTSHPAERSFGEPSYGQCLRSRVPVTRPFNNNESQRTESVAYSHLSSTFRQNQNENVNRRYVHQNIQQPIHRPRIINNSQRMDNQSVNKSSQNVLSNGYTSNKRMRFDHPVQTFSRDHYQQYSNSYYEQQYHDQQQYHGQQQYHVQEELPHQYPPRRNHATHSSRRSTEHPTAENITWQSELSSRSSDPAVKNCVHKCTYCQRIFKNYINVYNHLVRNHTSDIPNHRDGQIKPISSFDGRMTVWSLVSS